MWCLYVTAPDLTQLNPTFAIQSVSLTNPITLSLRFAVSVCDFMGEGCVLDGHVQQRNVLLWSCGVVRPTDDLDFCTSYVWDLAVYQM